MFNQKFKQMLLIIFSISVLVFGIKQYQENKAYETFISHVITNNSQELIEIILHVNTIYDDILETNELTYRQLSLLNKYSTDILQVFQYNLGLAQQFGLYEESGEMEKIKEDLHEIEKLYSHLLNRDSKVDKHDEKLIAIDLNLIEKLKYINELNELWLHSINENIDEVTQEGNEFIFNTRQFQEKYGNRSISNRFWVNLLIDISAIHKDFLDKYNIYNIQQVL